MKVFLSYRTLQNSIKNSPFVVFFCSASSLKCHVDDLFGGVTTLKDCPKMYNGACHIAKNAMFIQKQCKDMNTIKNLQANGLQINDCKELFGMIQCLCDTDGCNVDELLMQEITTKPDNEPATEPGTNLIPKS